MVVLFDDGAAAACDGAAGAVVVDADADAGFVVGGVVAAAAS